MQSSHEDRRKNDRDSSFPLIDSEGRQVLSERRSGKDRRKNKRQYEVATEILNSIH